MFPKSLFFSLLLFVCLFSFASAGVYYAVDLSFENITLVVDDVRVVYDRFDVGENVVESGSSDFAIDLLNSEGRVVSRGDYILKNQVITEFSSDGSGGIDSGERTTLESGSFTIYLPYDPSVSRVVVYDSAVQLVESVAVLRYSAIVVNESSSVDSGTVTEVDSLFIWYVVIGIIVLILLLWFVLRRYG